MLVENTELPLLIGNIRLTYGVNVERFVSSMERHAHCQHLIYFILLPTFYLKAIKKQSCI